MTKIRPTLPTVLSLLVLAGVAVPAAAEPEPSSDLLLPWFEVHLSSQRTTLFAVGNAAEEPLDVKAVVHTNWGIPVLERTLRLRAGEVQTVNLRDWLVAGNVPDPVLRGVDLEHVQAALTGQLSPKDDLFYGTQADPFDPELAVGYVTLRVTSTPRRDALWGDYFWADPEQDFAEGELLVDIDFASPCGALCRTHRMRFLNGGGFDGGTKLVVWSPRRVQPAPDANAAFARLLAVSPFHREPGEEFDERLLELLPVQLVDVRELHLEEDFGWLDVKTDEEIYVGVRYSADRRYSVTLQTWCIPPEGPPPPPPGGPDEAAIELEKLTNGQDADFPPGPTVEDADEGKVPGAVTWEYVVTNTGDVPLIQIEVSDDREGAISCPKETLEPGESMTCTLEGTAPLQASAAFFYDNLGTATGRTEDGDQVTDDDPSHYQVPPKILSPPSIDIEKATNGHDADSAPGPELQIGETVTWTYVVTNTGQVTLTGVAVSDDREGAVSCPKSTLQPGESMTCTLTGTAVEGDYANLGSVTGSSQADGSQVSDSDPSHYHAMNIEGQGCTPGYWKTHTDSWPPTGFSTGQSVQSVFSAASAYPAQGSATLLQALSFDGGSGVEGGVEILLRAAVAGLLNTAHDGVTYPRTTAMLISDVDAALASGDRDTMLLLATQIDNDNNLGCPLN